MHISDGVLSPAVIGITSLLGTGTLAFSLRGIKTEEIPKISLMTAVFFVGSTIHIPIGPTSVHLLLTGFIGLVVGRHAAVSVLIALLLQLFLFHFGGISSLGANVLVESLPAMLLGMFLRPRLFHAGNKAFFYGFAAGFFSTAGSVLLLGIVLIQSNRRFGMGPFSTVTAVTAGHVPIMFIEGLMTGFAVQFIVNIRPYFFHCESTNTERFENEKEPNIDRNPFSHGHIDRPGDYE